MLAGYVHVDLLSRGRMQRDWDLVRMPIYISMF